MSVWNPDNIRDVAESIGISTLNKDVVDNLARDVEFRMGEVILEALKFMRHAKRTTLTTQDISQALRSLDVEPLYGYESTRPLRFGEAPIGAGQQLFYVEDEEVDFEKLINAPLPKVPREISFTAHWLAVEGVQPSIPQNPTSADSRNQELLPKGPGANPYLAATSGNDNVAVKPLVKHILSKELQLYFDRVCSAILDTTNDEYRTAAFASLRSDPGLHQLLPYFVQFVAEKVTHNQKNLFVLTQMMHLTSALLDNPSLYIVPYIAPTVAPVLTCMIGTKLPCYSSSNSPDFPSSSSALAQRDDLPPSFHLRTLSANLLTILSRLPSRPQNLRPRIARTCLKAWLDPSKPLGTHYGALLGFIGVAGTAGVRECILPNLAVYDILLREALEREDGDEGERGERRREVEAAVEVLVGALEALERDALWQGTMNRVNGHHQDVDEDMRQRVVDKVGSVVGRRVLETGRRSLVDAILERDIKDVLMNGT